jgi:hypothetical protein
MLDPTEFVSQPAPGRACGACTLCCKVYDVPVLDKPAGQWCRHALPGRGCGIHETRPDHCRAFYCLWMTQGWIGPEWKPDTAKMVMTIDPHSKYLLVQVDPGSAAAWKREPYYTQLRNWAAAWLRLKRHVVVFVGKSATVVLPDRDVPVGTIEPGDRIVSRQHDSATGMKIEIEKVKAAA